MTTTLHKPAQIRPDLLAEGTGVPVGDKFYHLSEPLPYRWKNEGEDNEQFQVFFEGKWQDAESIDFDFM